MNIKSEKAPSMTAQLIEITLSDRAPVKIDPTLWPKIVDVSDHDGKVECQANTEWYIRVREHADGRRLVYGAKEAGNGGQYAGFRAVHVGYLIEAPKPVFAAPNDDVRVQRRDEEIERETVRAIRRVAGAIEADGLGSDAIGSLPAREI